jgi:hypothetical protein
LNLPEAHSGHCTTPVCGLARPGKHALQNREPEPT